MFAKSKQGYATHVFRINWSLSFTLTRRGRGTCLLLAEASARTAGSRGSCSFTASTQMFTQGHRGPGAEWPWIGISAFWIQELSKTPPVHHHAWAHCAACLNTYGWIQEQIWPDNMGIRFPPQGQLSVVWSSRERIKQKALLRLSIMFA